MKRYATVTETTTYRIEFDAPEHTDMDELDELARAEWEANPGRKPHDYECEIEVEPADGGVTMLEDEKWVLMCERADGTTLWREQLRGYWWAVCPPGLEPQHADSRVAVRDIAFDWFYAE